MLAILPRDDSAGARRRLLRKLVTGLLGWLLVQSLSAEVTTIETISSGVFTISGDAVITTISDGTVTISGDASITTISAGTVIIGGAATITTLSAGTVTIGGAATITTLSNGAVNFTGSATVTTLSNGTVTFASTASVATLSAGSVIFSADASIGTITLGDITFNGATAAVTTITAGTINFNGAYASVTTINGGTVNLGATTLELSAGVLSGVITGANGSLRKVGAGTLTINSNNTFGGGIFVNEGTLFLGAASALGSGAIVLAQGAILDLNGLGVTNAITVAAGAVVQGGLESASATTTGDSTINFVLTGSSGLTKSDGGTLTLATPNFYTGPTVIRGASTLVRVAYLADGSSSLGTSALNDPTNLLLGAGATLEFTGTTATNSSRSFTLEGSARIVTSASAAPLRFSSSAIIGIDPSASDACLTLSAQNPESDNHFAASLSAADSAAGRGLSCLIKDGVGTWVLAGTAQRFQNDVYISVLGGTLGLSSGALPVGATLALKPATPSVTIRWEPSNTDDLSANLHLAAGAAVKLDVGINTVTFASSPIMGNGSSIEKVGAGTLRIADSVNAPTLNVTVTRGQFTVNGTVGAVVLTSGATLDGSGQLGSVAVLAGAHLTLGSLAVGSIVLYGGSFIDWKVGDATDYTTGFGKLTLSGDLDLRNAGSGVNRVLINIFSVGADGRTIGSPLNFDPPGEVASIRTFNFAVVGGNILLNPGQNIGDTFAFNPTGFTYSDGSKSSADLWSINSDSAGLMTLTAIPEPSMYGFGLSVLAFAVAAMRRRRKVE